MLRKFPLLALVPVLTLPAQPASALDIDRIEVKSRLGQPLLAEISVIPNSAAELDRLQAQLASPTTFARIGLARPRGVISDFRFKIVSNARGNPVIRITSSMPVTQQFLTFLIQADWGDGRLVREYSISLDAPDALPVAALPSVEVPDAAPSNAILRAPEPLAIPVVGGKTPAPAAPHSAMASPISVIAGKPLPSQPRSRTTQAPIPRSAPVRPIAALTKKPVSAPSSPAATGKKVERAGSSVTDGSAGGYGPVKSGDTLSKIAGSLVGEDYSLNQAMLALLRVNPDAFVDSNINLIRRGAVLRAPQPAELSRYSATEAAVMVSDQIARWREGRPTQPQPAALPQAGASATAGFVPAANPMAMAVSDDRPVGGAETSQRAGRNDEAQPPSRSPAWHAGGNGAAVVQGAVDALAAQETL